MTAIVAVTDPKAGAVVIGGDSAGMDNRLGIALHSEPKVWRQGPTVAGAAGMFRVAQVIRHRMTVPAFDTDLDDPLEWMVSQYVDAMRAALLEAGALTIWDETSTEELGDAGFVVGVGGRVFEVYEDFGIGELTTGYAVMGCGGPYAMGALAVTEGRTAEARVRLALEAAERHSAGVRAPFTIVSLPASR